MIGIKEKDFWEMTIGEVIREAKGIKFRLDVERKQRANFDYALAIMIGRTTVGMMGKNNSKLPSIEEVYPDVFTDEEIEEIQVQKRNKESAARFLQFANAFNRNYKSGENQ